MDFDQVYPAAGSVNSSVRVSPQRLAEVLEGRWVDVCSRD
jgi:prolyl-tRNA editing enzyme YbaK/EbsC (Cys-tRNA(Pro) deacylase)